jgi:arylsulfatase
LLNPDQLAAFEGIKPDDHLTHGFKGGKTEKISQIQSVEDMGRADQVLMDFTIKRVRELAAEGKPFFIDHCFMKAHADNFDNPDYPGLSASKYPYKNSIAEIDKHVGDLITVLEE